MMTVPKGIKCSACPTAVHRTTDKFGQDVDSGWFDTEDQLRAHIAVKHVFWIPFECILCPMICPTDNVLKLHYEQAHPNNIPKALYTHEEQKKNEMLQILAASSALMSSSSLPVQIRAATDGAGEITPEFANAIVSNTLEKSQAATTSTKQQINILKNRSANKTSAWTQQNVCRQRDGAETRRKRRRKVSAEIVENATPQLKQEIDADDRYEMSVKTDTIKEPNKVASSEFTALSEVVSHTNTVPTDREWSAKRQTDTNCVRNFELRLPASVGISDGFKMPMGGVGAKATAIVVETSGRESQALLLSEINRFKKKQHHRRNVKINVDKLSNSNFDTEQNDGLNSADDAEDIKDVCTPPTITYDASIDVEQVDKTPPPFLQIPQQEIASAEITTCDIDEGGGELENNRRLAPPSTITENNAVDIVSSVKVETENTPEIDKTEKCNQTKLQDRGPKLQNVFSNRFPSRIHQKFLEYQRNSAHLRRRSLPH